jgi:hypothetical protein
MPLVDATADMLPALREQARQRAVEAARKELKAAEEKVARPVTVCKPSQLSSRPKGHGSRAAGCPGEGRKAGRRENSLFHHYRNRIR